MQSTAERHKSAMRTAARFAVYERRTNAAYEEQLKLAPPFVRFMNMRVVDVLKTAARKLAFWR